MEDQKAKSNFTLSVANLWKSEMTDRYFRFYESEETDANFF